MKILRGMPRGWGEKKLLDIALPYSSFSFLNSQGKRFLFYSQVNLWAWSGYLYSISPSCMEYLWLPVLIHIWDCYREHCLYPACLCPSACGCRMEVRNFKIHWNSEQWQQIQWDGVKIKLPKGVFFITSPFICEVSEDPRFIFQSLWLKAGFITSINLIYGLHQPFHLAFYSWE